MRKHLKTLSLLGGLALLLTLPGAAHSQLRTARAPRLATAWSGGEAFPEGFVAQRGPGRRGGHRARGLERGERTGGQRARGHGRAVRRGRRGAGDRAGRSAVFGAGTVRSSLVARALGNADRIGLTNEQTDQINRANRAHREATISRRAAIEITELELRDLMGDDAPDIDAVEAKLREAAEYRITGRTEALRLDASVAEILTAEQLDELEDLVRDRRRDRGSRLFGRGQRLNR